MGKRIDVQGCRTETKREKDHTHRRKKKPNQKNSDNYSRPSDKTSKLPLVCGTGHHKTTLR